jgi:CRP-like cAMP-binding protein
MTSIGVKADHDLQAALLAHASGSGVYEAGERVFSEGKKCMGVFLVLSGTVKLFLRSGCGSRLMERIATAGCVLGLPSTVSAEPYSLTAETTERTELVYVSRARLTKLMQSDTISAIKLLGLLSGEVRTLRTEMAKSNAQRHGGAIELTK